MAAFVIRDGEAERAADVLTIVRAFVPELKDATADSVTVSILSGGITNQLYRVQSKDTGFSAVVRVFGKETERLISRDAERFWQESFLKTFGKCANGLVYEFLDGYVPLQPEDCAAHATDIAKELAEFHVAAARLSLFELPYATERSFSDVCLDATDGWLAAATDPATLARLTTDTQREHLAALDLTSVAADAAALHALIRKHGHLVPVVPCHNDLLSLNVMRHRESGRVRFIDFEYTKRNHYLADIGNHFCEYGGFDGQWSRCPGRGHQRAFLEAYHARIGELTTGGPRVLSGDAMEQQLALLALFSRFSDMSWTVWAVVQAAYSVIDFDYLEFARSRYAHFKSEWDATLEALGDAGLA